MKPKILHIAYGGTITMIVKDNRVMPAEKMEDILKLIPSLSDVADITFSFLTDKDSTNVNQDDWTRLGLHIAKNMDAFDGFLITHGTNTLAYTASALSLALGPGLQKPVVITGSQLPLTVYGNDARFNFENSVQTLAVAIQEEIAEVMVVFDDLVLRGARAVKVSEQSFRAFMSPAFPPIGTITSTGVRFDRNVHKKNPEVQFALRPHFTPGVLSIDLTPGQLPSLFMAIVESGKCKGIVLKSHGAGSVPIEGEHNFIPFIKITVNEYKIPIIISTKFLGGNPFKKTNDEPAVLALEAGAIPSGDLTDVMTEVKLMWVLAQGVNAITEVRSSILRGYTGEISEEKAPQI